MEALRSLSTIESCFSHFDKRGKGYLDYDELKAAASALLGVRVGKYELKNLFRDVDVQRGIAINKDRFVSTLQPCLSHRDLDEDIYQVFKALDVDGDACISLGRMQELFRSVGCPDDVASQMFRELDRDGDGRVTIVDFKRLRAHFQ
jgi:Ca2+-binding EF-hand superfamily protein